MELLSLKLLLFVLALKVVIYGSSPICPLGRCLLLLESTLFYEELMSNSMFLAA